MTDYIEIDKCEWGLGYTTITEVRNEQHNGNHYVRFRFTQFKTSGTQGKEKKSFEWPVSDIVNIFETILDANSGKIEVQDPRGAISRMFNKIFGIEFINSRERFVEHDHFDSICWLSFEIVKEKTNDFVVTLKHLKGKNRQIWVNIPIESVEKLSRWANANLK